MNPNEQLISDLADLLERHGVELVQGYENTREWGLDLPTIVAEGVGREVFQMPDVTPETLRELL